MQLRLKTKLVLIAISCCLFRLGAQQTYSKHFTINDGLPSNAVYCIFKDSRGIIWIGTDNGLVKFDGYSFHTFTSKDGLAGNFIWDIKEDFNRNIWIACSGDGLTKFNGSTFKNYGIKDGLVHLNIRKLFFDSKGKLYIGTNRGLSIWDGKRFTNFLTKSFFENNEFQIMQFWQEKGKIYFLSRTHGYYRINETPKGYTYDSLGKNLAQLHFIKLSDEKLYAISEGFYSDNTNSKFPLNFKDHLKLSNDLIWDHQIDGHDCFLASYGVFASTGGLLKYRNGILKNVNSRYGISSNQIWTLFLDKKSRQLWIGTMDNGFFIIDLQPKIHFKTQKNIRNIYTNNKGEKIILSSNSITISTNHCTKNIDIKKFVRFAKSQINSPQYRKSTLRVKTIINEGGYEFSQVNYYDNCIYVSSNFGLFELNRNGDFISYYPREGDVVYKMKNGKIIFPWPFQIIAILSKKAKKWSVDNVSLVGRNSPLNIHDIEELNGIYYLASKTNGIFSIEPSHNPKKLFLDHLTTNKIMSICGNKTNLFIATNEREIFVYNQKNKLTFLKKYSGKNFIGESIISIEYCFGSLIVLTNRGLNIIRKNKTIFIDKEQGLELENISCTSVDASHLYIGTKTGYFTINIKSFIINQFIPEKASLKSFIISNELISFNKLWKNNNSKTIELSYNQNDVDLLLNINEYHHPKKIQLSYSLNSSNWIKIVDNRISLQQLSSGHYTIWIQQEDLLNGKTIIYKLVELKVGHPFWKSIWFITLMIIAILIGIFYIYRQNIRRVQRQENQKSTLSKRISETKLEALQSQMNPHFIFNALNAIQNYVIKNDVDNALFYMGEFSKLIRQTLEFSAMSKVKLIDEIDYLQRFVKLENMRFGNRVQVDFKIGEIDTSKIMIPPLIIQPLFENAFEHGFINQAKSYQLILDCKINENKLILEVRDNGEGIQKSNTNSHESKAMSIIRERISLLDTSLLVDFYLKREEDWTIVLLSLPLITIE
jgi:ligand-binding sensor domain-containing protein